MEKGPWDCVDLHAAARVLAASRAVQAVVKDAVGIERFQAALKLMKSGRLEGDLGVELYDLLNNRICNYSDTVWSGVILSTDDEYPVNVNVYHGVYWAWALEYDPVGYFLDEEAAIDYARSAWGEVIPDDEYGEGEECDLTNVRCPYCDATDQCDHLLLMVDTTFRQAEGGALFGAFNNRLSAIVNEADDPDLDEQGPFDELLEEVSALANEEIHSSSDNVPGMSANYILYFCDSKHHTAAALEKFTGL